MCYPCLLYGPILLVILINVPPYSIISRSSVIWNSRVIECFSIVKDGKTYSLKHRENSWAFNGSRIDFVVVLLISNIIIHRSFTGPTHLLSVNVPGPVSFAVSVR